MAGRVRCIAALVMRNALVMHILRTAHIDVLWVVNYIVTTNHLCLRSSVNNACDVDSDDDTDDDEITNVHIANSNNAFALFT